MGKGLRGRKPGRRRKKKGGFKTGTLFFIAVGFFVLFGAVFFATIDARLLPVVLKTIDSQMVSKINIVINDAIIQSIEGKNLESADFYEKTVGSEGKINSIAVNTVLINKICNELAVNISLRLDSFGKQKVQVPVGALTNIQAIANLGPGYTINIMPTGNATVDYSSSFEAVGINQVNFQIWLNVESKIKVVNPLQDTELKITKKVPLVNTIINSEVPQMYLNNIPSFK